MLNLLAISFKTSGPIPLYVNVPFGSFTIEKSGGYWIEQEKIYSWIIYLEKVLVDYITYFFSSLHCTLWLAK